MVLGMNNGMRTFGIILDIIVFSTDIYYLVCSLLFTECFSHHFHAFQVFKQHREEYLICKPSALHDSYVLSAYCIPHVPVCNLEVPTYRLLIL